MTTLDGRTIGGVVQVLRWVSEQIGHTYPQYASALSQVAAVLINGGPRTGCERCGNPVPANRTGRPRKYCTACSPLRHASRMENSPKSPHSAQEVPNE